MTSRGHATLTFMLFFSLISSSFASFSYIVTTRPLEENNMHAESHLLSLSRTLPSSYYLRGARASDLVPAGGAGGLPHLRWPPGLREVLETAVLLPVGGGGPGWPRVRVWFPAAASRRRRHQGIRSSRSLSRLAGTPLWCRRRARGGGSPHVESLYRSPSAAVRRPRGVMRSPPFYVEGTVAVPP